MADSSGPEFKNQESASASTADIDFQWIEGRRLPNTPYMLPKDWQETHRLDLQHVMLSSLLGGNIVAPIGNPTSILDVGCGTGRWCQEMATTFPNAHITGVDMVIPEQGVHPWPHNCTFLAGNVLQGLPFADESFDVVHQRLLVGALPAARWQDVINELVRVTRIGGWIELIETEGIFPKSGPYTQQISQWLVEAGKRRGIDVLIGRKLKDFLQETDVEKVHAKTLSIPMGNHNDPIESMSADVVHALFQSLKPLVVTSLNVSKEEYDRLLSLVRNEWEEHGTLNPLYIAYGQRSK